MKGIQGAGFANTLVADSAEVQYVLQAAGFNNVIRGRIGGMQVAGFNNFLSDIGYGIQAAGFLNTAGWTFNGLQ